MLGAALLILAGVIGVNLYTEHTAIDAYERERLATQARVIDENLGQQLRATGLALDSIRADLPFLLALTDGKYMLQRRLKSLSDVLPGVRTLLVLDTDGTVVAANREELVGLNFGQRDYFQTTRRSADADLLHVSAPFKTSLGVLSLNLTKVILNQHKQFNGVVSATLDPEYFKVLLDSVLYAPDMWTSLSHADGTVFLVRPSRPDVHGLNLNRPGSFRSRHLASLQKATVLTGTSSTSGEERMMAQRTINQVNPAIDQPLIVATARNLTTIFAAWRQDVYVHFCLFGMLVLFGVASLFVFQKRQRAYDHVVANQEVERKDNETRLGLLAQRAEALLQLPGAAQGTDEHAFMQHGLALAEQLTGSQISFVHFVLEDQETIELLTWSVATLANYCQASIDRHYPISQAGIWADALRQRAPVLVNDYANTLHKHGLPPGHTHLERLISVPVMESDRVHMMLGVGNKPQAYTGFDVETVRLIADAIWRIVQQRRSDTALRKSEESLREAQHIAGLGSYVLDIADGYWDSSVELDQLFGIDASYRRTVQGWQSLIHPDDQAMMESHFRDEVLGQRKSFNKEYRICRHADQSPCWVHGLGKLEFDADGRACRMRGTIQDITQRKAKEEEIRKLVYTDTLTGLPNRRFLMDRLERALANSLRHQRQGALLLVDLDNFKLLNDTLGHHQGDLMLQQVASRMSDCMREGDTVARLGGDEFVVLLENLSGKATKAATQAKIVCDKILLELNRPYQLGDAEHLGTASIGVTLFGDHSENVEDPLKRADLAMYQSKVAGHNGLRFFDPLMQATIMERVAMEGAIRVALQKNQFTLCYQAQVVGNGRITGVEALVRWQHPQRGQIPPADFIALAEETSLIRPLGQWVLQSACHQLAQWADRPELAHLTIAVNVSAKQFHQSDFVDLVTDALECSGARADRLKLELTESLLVVNIEDVIVKMSTLKNQGIGFSIDDFGTGYSSLSYLKRLPLDQLKIDQSFVRNILTDPNDAAIAQMVIALANTLGLAVIAEGVENEAQRDFLAGLGCPAYQGYLISQPLPIEEFEALAAR